MKNILCSDCFKDEGLRLDAQRLGNNCKKKCKNCGLKSGKKLDENLINQLADRFFVRGTLNKSKYGAAPLVQFNQHRKTELELLSPALKEDCKAIAEAVGIGFFYYGPRLWMIGGITPLEDLLKAKKRNAIIERVMAEYPIKILTPNERIYRLRKNPHRPDQNDEYDSPPIQLSGKCRFGSNELPILYSSQDLEVCVHECRTTVEDELYVATLTPKRELKLLNLTEILEEDTTEFESLDIAIHMLFSAGKHSYKISRAIALAAKKAGFDGILYPSYFSDFRTGSRPFDTVYGISIRRIPDPNLKNYIKNITIPNIALFGRPIADNMVEVNCINKLVLSRILYDFHFGPVGL